MTLPKEPVAASLDATAGERTPTCPGCGDGKGIVYRGGHQLPCTVCSPYCAPDAARGAEPFPPMLASQRVAIRGVQEAVRGAERHNGQQEPGYPGAGTVAMSLRYPMMTVHKPSSRCAIQEPHKSAECGEFVAAPPRGAAAPLREAAERVLRDATRNGTFAYSVGVQSLDALSDALAALPHPATDEPSAEDLLASDVREVLCRVFDDYDEAWEEWGAWYQPAQWLHGYRALGAFIRQRLTRPATDEPEFTAQQAEASYAAAGSPSAASILAAAARPTPTEAPS